MSALLVAALAAPWVAAALGAAVPEAAAGAAVLAAAFLAAAAVVLAPGAAVAPVEAFGGLLRLDALGAWVLATTALLGLAATAASVPHVRRMEAKGEATPRSRAAYHALLSAFLGTMAAAPALGDLGGLWVAVEATTLASVFLVGFERRSASIEAAWKFVILSTVGLGFALLGTVLLAAASPLRGTPEALRWASLARCADGLDPSLARLAFVLILVGYGTKAGIAPMHAWLPDAHSQAPAPVSALLSGALLQTALYAVARFRFLVAPAAGPLPGDLLVLLGLVSAGGAALFLVVQTDLKRLLAYSSVEHIGVMAVGFGLGTPAGACAALLHAASHAAAKGLAFLCAGEAVEHAGSRRLPRLSGTISSLRFSGPLLAVGVLALAGLPPSGLFAAELLLLRALLEAGRPIAAALVALALATAFGGLVHQASRGLWGRPTRRMRLVGAAPEALGASVVAAGALALVLLGLGLRIPDAAAGVLAAAAGAVSR